MRKLESHSSRGSHTTPTKNELGSCSCRAVTWPRTAELAQLHLHRPDLSSPDLHGASLVGNLVALDMSFSLHTHTCKDACMCTCVDIYIFIYMYMYPYIHTQTQNLHLLKFVSY